MSELYLIQGVGFHTVETYGTATKNQVNDKKYRLNLVSAVLKNSNEFLPWQIVAFPIKSVNFSDMSRYIKKNVEEDELVLPGSISIYSMNDYDFLEHHEGLYSIKRHIKKLQTELLPSYVAGKRITESIFKQKNVPIELKSEINKYLGFGKKRKIVKQAKLVLGLKKKTMLTKALKNQAKKYKVRLTLKRGNKRVYKSEKMLKKQIKNAMTKKKSR
jgi:hypothetical protein